jgi:tRNA pseudouridine55 synthase
VGEFGIDSAHTLDQLEDEFSMVPIAEAARSSFPCRDLDEAQASDVRFGRALHVDLDVLTAVFAPDGEFLALYEPRDGAARAVAVFV